MNKLLSSKVLALSMLALAVGESWGMNQNPPLNNSQTNMPQKIVVNIPSDISLEGNINYHTLTILARSPSYQWFKNKGVTSTKGIKIIYREVLKYLPLNIVWLVCDYSQKMDICTWLDGRWSELSPIFDLVEIRTTNQFGCKSYETKRKREILQTWDVQNSLSAKWASQNHVGKLEDLLSLTLKAISLSRREICVERYPKRDKLLLLKLLDDNWKVLQPFMDQAYAELQSPFLIQAPQPQSFARIPAAQPNWPVQQQHMYPLPFQLPIIQEAQIQTNQGDPIHECSIERLLNHH